MFNPEGQIVQWEGAPVLVEYSVEPDSHLAAEVDTWRNAFEEWGKTVLGYATQSFDQDSCKQRECTMGNMVADAMLQLARTPTLQNQDPETVTRPRTDIAFINSGGIRSGLPQGNITIEMIMTTSPFGNGLVQTQMTGAEIKAMLEAVAAGRYKDTQKLVTSNIQISGLRYSFDSSKPLAETHLIKAEIRGDDDVWRDISEKQKYWVVSLDFVLGGGDNILERKERRGTKLALLDQVLMDYIKNKGEITPYLDGRIKDVSKTGPAVASRMVKAWPPGTPEHIKSRYPGGSHEKLRDYIRLQNQDSKIDADYVEGGVGQQVLR